MIPRTAGRGHSFKGAGLYYLHDKQADTKDRVAWTHTHNLPTQDAEKAMKVMAFTSMNAEYYKDRVGGSKAGRKATRGAVFTFSLAWHPEQNPDKAHMLDTTFSALKKLGLDKDHQSVILAHNDTDHPHVHVIANLVSLENGKRAKLSYDHLSLSAWAEEYERENGHKIYCEQRVKNNHERKKLAQAKSKNQHQDLQQKFKEATAQNAPENKPKTGIVKYKEDKHERAALIQELYKQSDSGKAFNAALQEKGYALANGNRRSFVVVDEQGKIYSLSRQMKGFWEKDENGRWKSDLKEKLADLALQDAQEVSKQKAQTWEENQYFYRDDYETERQKNIVDSAIQEDEKKQEMDRKDKSKNPKDLKKNKAGDNERGAKKEHELDVLKNYKSFADEYQPIADWSDDAQRKRLKLAEELEQFYNRKALVREIKKIEQSLKSKERFFDKFLGKKKEAEQRLDGLQKTLANIDMRIQERKDALEIEIQKSKPKGGQSRYDRKDLTQKLTRKIKDQDREGYDHTLDR